MGTLPRHLGAGPPIVGDPAALWIPFVTGHMIGLRHHVDSLPDGDTLKCQVVLHSAQKGRDPPHRPSDALIWPMSARHGVNRAVDGGGADPRRSYPHAASPGLMSDGKHV